MSARKSSHRTIFLIVSSGSPLALIASSLRSTSKKPLCPMTRSLHPPITACGHRVRFVGTWREKFFEAPQSHFVSPPSLGERYAHPSCYRGLLPCLVSCRRVQKPTHWHRDGAASPAP